MRGVVGAKSLGPNSGAPKVPGTEMVLTWPPPPPRPFLAPGQIHVFRAALDVPQHGISQLLRFLTPAERARAKLFPHAHDGHRYVAGHAALRTVLARYLACAPAEVKVATDAAGRPFVSAPSGPESLFFNIAHAGDMALVAVTMTGPIGVDLAEIQEFAALETLADRFLSPEESRALKEFPHDLRTAAFFRCWTRKEAVLKAGGGGLEGDLSHFEVNLDSENARIIRWGGRSGRASGWKLRHLAPAPGFVGALALWGPIRNVLTWSWLEDGRVNPPRPASPREPVGLSLRARSSPEFSRVEDAPAAE